MGKRKTLMKITKILITLVLVLNLTACSSSPFTQGPEYGFALDWDEISFESDAAKNDTLKEEQFKLNLTRVTDLRSPEDRVPSDTSNIIYDYRPDHLVNGLEGYVKSSVNKYMNYPDDAQTQLGLEIDIKKFKTTVEHAWFKRYGQYRVDAEFEFLVRDADSRVLMRETVVVGDSQWRQAFKGALPSAKRDRNEMKKLVKTMMSDITLDLGWMVHSAFNQQRKYYHPMKELNEWVAD
ncbi:MAG: hypothetical protein ACI9TY_001808 [Alphaproteobacteria bacterium]|jgi:hypothetical protein